MIDTFEKDESRNYKFDEFLNVTEAQRDVLCDWLQPLCDGNRLRARSPAQQAQFKLTLGVVVANALIAGRHRRGPWCHYSRAAGTYSTTGAYNPAWLSFRVFTQTVDRLVEAGVLAGRTSRPTTFGETFRSTFEATGLLLDGAEARGIQVENIAKDEDAAPVIILKRREVRTDKRGKEFVVKPLVNYRRDAEDILALDTPVRAYNEFLAAQDFGWEVSPEVLAALLQTRDDEGRPFVPPDVNQCRLRRTYNDGSWERGGRFYGGWWQTVPSQTRSAITINGRRTVELDFGGFLPRAIYHREGIEFEGDAYDIPAIHEIADRRGLDWDSEVRPSIKTMFNVILNSPSPEGSSYVSGIKLPKRMSKKEGYRLIEEHHERIAAWFWQGRGLGVMNLESNVCQRILSAGLADGVVVLPVHDSFVVPDNQKAWLQGMMAQFYREEFNFPPVIH